MQAATSLSGFSLINNGPLTVPDGDVGTVYGIWTIGGQTITGGLDTITATTPQSIVTTSFAPSKATSYVGVALNDMFILVHQASDSAIASTTSTASTASAASSTSKTNSAMRVRSNENRLGAVATVCYLTLALGALLVV